MSNDCGYVENAVCDNVVVLNIRVCHCARYCITTWATGTCAKSPRPRNTQTLCSDTLLRHSAQTLCYVTAMLLL